MHTPGKTGLTALSSNLFSLICRWYKSLGSLGSDCLHLDPGGPRVLLVSEIGEMPLHEVDLFLGSFQHNIEPHLVLMGLALQVNVGLMHQLKDGLLHRDASALNVVLRLQTVALLHEVLDRLVDLWGSQGISGPLLLDLIGERLNSFSGKSFSLQKSVDVFVQLSPIGMAEESNLALFVNKNDVRDFLDSEERHGFAHVLRH